MADRSEHARTPAADAERVAIERDQIVELVIGGVTTSRLTRAELAIAMVADAQRADIGLLRRPRFVTYSNGANIALYHRDPAFRALMAQADIIDPDGMPLVLASRLLCRHPLLDRVATTDFIVDASAAAAAAGVRFFFVGAEPGVAATAAARLRARFPSLQIVGVRDGFFRPDEEASLVDEVRESRAHILWLGLGSPRQERFAVKHRDALAGLAWIRTCGGMFDHLSGRFRRAPAWVQRCGLEWLVRAVQEPRRLGMRYWATNPLAAYHLLTKTHD